MSDAGRRFIRLRRYRCQLALNSTECDNAYDTGVLFAQKIKELTNGRVRVDLYGGAQLGTTAEVLEGMYAGVADVMCESIGTLATFTSLANIEAMPYMFSSYDHFMNVWYSDLGQEIKDAVGDMPLILHTHCTTGMAYMTYTKAIESGIDVIDTATSCFSGGTSQPATETMFYALQQYGIELFQRAGFPDSSGRAGFLTALYMVLVPLFNLAFGKKAGLFTWIGVGFAAIGLFLVSVSSAFTISPEDLVVLGCAVLFAAHILVIDRFGDALYSLRFSMIQFLVCTVLSLAAWGITVAAGIHTPESLADLKAAIVPLLYGGFMSVGVAYTCQVLGQKRADPAVASVLLSMESMFTDDTYCVWRTEFDEKKRLCYYGMDIFRLEGEHWQRSFEEHIEYAYEPAELQQWLAEAGFTRIRSYGDRVLRAPKEAEQRIYFSAKKE